MIFTVPIVTKLVTPDLILCIELQLYEIEIFPMY